MTQSNFYIIIFCFTISCGYALSQLPSSLIPLPPIANTVGIDCNDLKVLGGANNACRLVEIAFNTCPTCGIIGLQQYYNCSGYPGLIAGSWIGGTGGSIFYSYTLGVPTSDYIVSVNGSSSLPTGSALGKLGFTSSLGIQGVYGYSTFGPTTVDTVGSGYCIFTLDVYVQGSSCSDPKGYINGVTPYTNNQWC